MKDLIKKLRAYANQYEQPPFGREIYGTPDLLREAADTIEELTQTNAFLSGVSKND